MDRLESIGFYTLSDERARMASVASPLSRCEIILTGRCNFKCPYCRHVGGKDADVRVVVDTIERWARDGLGNIRFSGGEPTLYHYLSDMVRLAKEFGIARIAVSTNGSAHRDFYQNLIEDGVSDFSVSLDACCAEDGDLMAGGVKGAWNRVTNNIRFLSSQVYTTVGVVLTPANIGKANDIVVLAASLGVQDIRVIPAAQDGRALQGIVVDPEILAKYPILRYRIRNMQMGQSVRGLAAQDSNRCGLVLDDMAVMGWNHYPCIIYLREGGLPIGAIGDGMRMAREGWYRTHDTYSDPICRNNCLDVCRDYNNRYALFHS